MIESVLYFILGFLCSGMIALMVSPAIWNRAVTLTKKRIESSVPLTLNEIQADKDQLRAEFAMSTRRLEMSIQELQETASNQVIEINRKRDDLAKLAEESNERIKNVEELELKSSELRAALIQRENALEEAKQNLQETNVQLEERALELEKMRTDIAKLKSDSDSSRIELIASQTSMEDLSDQIKAKDSAKQELAEQLSQSKKELRALKSEIVSKDDSASDIEKRISRVQKLNNNLEQKLQDREQELAQIRKADQENEKTNSQLVKQLTSESERANKLETKLAKASLRMEAVLEDASNENVKKAMASLNQDRNSLKKEITKLSKERDKLAKEVSGQKQANDADWEVERKENAILRERINDLAAQVTAMTASLEGPDSPINKIVGKSSKTVSKKASTRQPKVETLADRIKALQETANAKRA